jgi:hypothetical protein
MLSSFRLSAAAILAMGALTAGCAGPMSSASSGGASAQANSSGLPLYASVYKNDARFYEPRMYRSKCDDNTDITQRVACYEQEREDQLMLEDGKD